METFLSILKEYFESKNEDEILVNDGNDIIIPIEWIFTEGIDRAIIEKAMVNLLKKSNSKYFDRVDFLGKEKDKIKDFLINIYNGKIKVIVRGVDNWTKAIISDNPNPDSGILIVSEEDFYKEILNILKESDIQKTCDEIGLSEEARKNLFTFFNRINLEETDKVALEGIRKSMKDAAKNLGDYYDYLTEEKKQASSYHTTIHQSKDEGGKRGRDPIPSTKVDRKSEIYPFTDRAKILKEMNPKYTIDVDEIDDEGNKKFSSYTVFVYENPNNKDGYLFVAEPLEGAHNTRVTYISQEEFEQFPVKDGEEKIVKIAKHYLEMTTKEFDESENSRRIMHTEMESFKERLRCVVLGEEPQSKKSQYNYMKMMEKIYGIKKFGARDIGKNGESATASQVAAVEEIFKSKERTPTKKGD